ncbi:hypothetical protein [Sphingobium yanoikuyae]|uniref:hypothetical protein n=1 Tax=Sphingobium yanoikuyae TaxID=13690 RepID=UPI001479069C|nr:hypothetical protein [Sphingobium yanoikuyae]
MAISNKMEVCPPSTSMLELFSGYNRQGLRLSGLTLFLFHPLDFAFENLANEACPPLGSNQLINPLAQSFGQTHIGRSEVKRRSSHAFVVTAREPHSTGSRISGTAYCNIVRFAVISGAG